MSEDTITVDNIVKNLKRSFEMEENDNEKDGDKKFYGVVTGTVINPLDPQGLGRVQVQLPFIDSLDLSPWARVAGPMAGIFHGTYFVPNPGDEVLVAFEHGDINAPYIIGSLWNMIWRPPLPSPLPQIRAIRTLAGNQIVFSEIPPTITIQAGPTPPAPIPMVPTPAGPATIAVTMLPAGPVISLMAGINVINMTVAGIQMIAGDNMINMTPAGINIVSAKNLNLSASGTINITAGAACTINASLVKIN